MANTESITTRVPPALKARCEAKAKELGQDDVSKFVRWVLIEWFDKNDPALANDFGYTKK